MSRSDRILVAAVGSALVLAVAAGIVLLMPADASPADDQAFLVSPPASALASPSVTPTTSGTIIVDVAGAVARPGLVELTAEARVGEAITAAGGYATDADLEAVASINLARPLTDGEQVRVPRVGETVAAAPSPSGGGGQPPATGAGGTTGGLVNLNTATPEQLEALPGIGPVTVQKIVAARQEQPFTSLGNALQRGIIHSGQLEDIRDVATAG